MLFSKIGHQERETEKRIMRLDLGVHPTQTFAECTVSLLQELGEDYILAQNIISSTEAHFWSRGAITTLSFNRT